MSRFFRYGFPYQYYYNNYPSYAPTPKVPVYKQECEPSPISNSYSKTHSQNHTQPENICQSKKDENIWFDLFGIKLYFDDVLILSLLFFLYKEDVKDEGLFLALILLLIS